MAGITLLNNPWAGGNQMGTIPWAEWGIRRGMTEANFGFESGNQAIFPIVVDFANHEFACQQLLGDNFRDSTTITQLNRIPPALHPYYPGLYCSKVHVRPYKSLGKTNSSGPLPTTWNNWKYAILTATFTQPRWNRTLNDSDLDLLFPPIAGLRQEWQRSTVWQPNPMVETISRPANQLVWGESGVAASGVVAGATLPVDQAILLGKVDITLTWSRVPGRGLFNSTTFMPDSIIAALGTVNNNTTLFGAPVGTLLFKGCSIVPIENAQVFGATSGGRTPTMFNVNLSWSFFKPSPEGTGTYHGHVLSIGPDGSWYVVGNIKNIGTQMLPSYDHTQIFKMVA